MKKNHKYCSFQEAIHGTQNLTQDTKFIVFKSKRKESIKDDYRYKSNYWGDWIIKSR